MHPLSRIMHTRFALEREFPLHCTRSIGQRVNDAQKSGLTRCGLESGEKRIRIKKLIGVKISSPIQTGGQNSLVFDAIVFAAIRRHTLLLGQ